MSDPTETGIEVVEGPSIGAPVSVSRVFRPAIIGLASRGPVDRAVPISDPAEARRLFAVKDRHSPLVDAIEQYFAAGGEQLLAIRVIGREPRVRIRLTGSGGRLELEARQPGRFEVLRASVDYDDIEPDALDRFNLVVQRLADSTGLVEEQEIFRDLSSLPGEPRYIGEVLRTDSQLVVLRGKAPGMRPDETLTHQALVGYVDGVSESRRRELPRDYDLLGSADRGTGLGALAEERHVDALVLALEPEACEPGPIALHALERFCHDRHLLLLMDVPGLPRSAREAVQAARQLPLSGANVVLAYPRLQVPVEGGGSREQSALGALAGALAVTDSQADISGLGAIGFRSRCRPLVNLSDSDVRTLSRSGINALIRVSPRVMGLLGGVTLEAGQPGVGARSSLLARRTTLFILQSITRELGWVCAHDSDSRLWTLVAYQVNEFLMAVHERGLLAGATPEQGFVLKCDEDTNRDRVGARGEVEMVLGLALGEPGRFEAFRITVKDGYCRVGETGWVPQLALAV